MGMNYYLVTKNKELAKKYTGYEYGLELTDTPDWGYQIHVCKKSFGWDPIFQGYYSGVKAVALYKEAYETGEFLLADEEGRTYDWDGFMEEISYGKEGNRKHAEYSDFVDDEGYEFLLGDFC